MIQLRGGALAKGPRGARRSHVTPARCALMRDPDGSDPLPTVMEAIEASDLTPDEQFVANVLAGSVLCEAHDGLRGSEIP